MLQRSKIIAFDFLYTGKSVYEMRISLPPAVGDSGIDKKKQLLIDISTISKTDARTGIQRVVRALLNQLLTNPPNNYVVRPVFATAKHGYRYINYPYKQQDNNRQQSSTHAMIEVYPGDIFLGLDLSANIFSKHLNQLKHWKHNGLKVHMLVYDLLPLLNPEWFHNKTTLNFYKWLRCLSVIADSAVCISDQVKNDLNCWIKQKYHFETDALPVHVVPLGSDISASIPSVGLPENYHALLDQFRARPSALVVGTLEPRKSISEVLIAFEKLWLKGESINLVIVGKAGWKTQPLQKRIVNHPKLNKYLFWLPEASDQFLEMIYGATSGLIIASKGEGFGLPLVEAARHRKPILARDLPVFRSIAKDGVTFFRSSDGAQFSEIVSKWLETANNFEIADSKVEQTSWSYCAERLCTLICIHENNQNGQ
jgi:glycosyltransferase involved in cell wall biosynthesis